MRTNVTYGTSFGMRRGFGVLLNGVPERCCEGALGPCGRGSRGLAHFPTAVHGCSVVGNVVEECVNRCVGGPRSFVIKTGGPRIMFTESTRLNGRVVVLTRRTITGGVRRDCVRFIGRKGGPRRFGPRRTISVRTFVGRFGRGFVSSVDTRKRSLVGIVSSLASTFAVCTETCFRFITFKTYCACESIMNGRLVGHIIDIESTFPIPGSGVFTRSCSVFTRHHVLAGRRVVSRFCRCLSRGRHRTLSACCRCDTAASDSGTLLG